MARTKAISLIQSGGTKVELSAVHFRWMGTWHTESGGNVQATT